MNKRILSFILIDSFVLLLSLTFSFLLRFDFEIPTKWKERKISISRELTKKFEEHARGTAQELLHHFEQGSTKGEFVVVIQGIKG